jgi:hypothetical protein
MEGIEVFSWWKIAIVGMMAIGIFYLTKKISDWCHKDDNIEVMKDERNN